MPSYTNSPLALPGRRRFRHGLKESCIFEHLGERGYRTLIGCGGLTRASFKAFSSRAQRWTEALRSIGNAISTSSAGHSQEKPMTWWPQVILVIWIIALLLAVLIFIRFGWA
jgi:hypothetical protein